MNIVAYEQFQILILQTYIYICILPDTQKLPLDASIRIA